nr:uncharacterized protein LOC131780895 [Pocillopora verrucosa]
MRSTIFFFSYFPETESGGNIKHKPCRSRTLRNYCLQSKREKMAVMKPDLGIQCYARQHTQADQENRQLSLKHVNLIEFGSYLMIVAPSRCENSFKDWFHCNLFRFIIYHWFHCNLFPYT